MFYGSNCSFKANVDKLRSILLITCLGLLLLAACGTNEETGQQNVGANLSIDEQIAQTTEAINADRFDAPAFQKRAQLHLLNGDINKAMDDIAVAIKNRPDCCGFPLRVIRHLLCKERCCVGHGSALQWIRAGSRKHHGLVSAFGVALCPTRYEEERYTAQKSAGN